MAGSLGGDDASAEAPQHSRPPPRSSSQLSGEGSQASLGEEDHEHHGMASLNRAQFTPQEMSDRYKFCPILRKTLSQIDGTAKPPFSHFKKRPTKAECMLEFGMNFYQELFERSPEIRDQLFSNKPPELLATKLGEILAEVVRLLEVETPPELKEQMTEMSLRHIEYGLQEHHVDPFKDALMACIKSTVKGKGFKWSQKIKRAWDWSLTEVTDLLMDGVNIGRPRVESLRRSWIYICERLYMEEYETNRLARSSFVGTSAFQASQFGPSYHSMLGEDIAAKEEQGPKKIKIGNEILIMPEKKSRKQVNLKDEAKKSNAQRERERLREKAKKKAKNKELGEKKKMDKISLKLLAAKTVGALRVGLTSLFIASASDKQEEEFRMWSKKDLMTNATAEYLRGRLLVGQKFIQVFASRNPWAVTQFDFGLKANHAEKMGEALELIVNSSTKPQVLQHKLRVLSIGHNQMGIKPSMFPAFEESLFDFLKTSLGEYGQWNKPVEQGWKWMWDIVNKAFSKHLVSAESVVGKIERSWKYIEDNYDISDISDIFFKKFFHKEPGLQMYFVKPTKMQRVMFAKAVDLIVKSVRDQEVLNVELKGIAMRHIKYDITIDHLKVFGVILLDVFRDTIGEDHWDEEVDEAWLEVYGHIADIFHHIISTGKNMVSRALATGNPEELRRALDTAPRAKRVTAALEIETDDSVISPIVWTLQEGQMQMAEELLKDALAIRGDREAYYCGRERLWKKHPYLIRLLVTKAPQLLPVLLDGHLWVSRFMEDGTRRVNFYIAELYGDPEKDDNVIDAYNTALGVFVSKLPLNELPLFAHPVIVYLVDLKWNQFGRRKFLSLQMLNVINLVLGMMYLLLGDEHPVASFAFALGQLLAVAIRVMSYQKSIKVQLKYHNGVTTRIFGKKFFVPYALSDPFMIINILSSIMCIVMFALTWVANPFGWQHAIMPYKYEHCPPERYSECHDAELLVVWADVAAFTSGMLCVQLVECFKLTKTMSAMLFAIIAVLADVFRFLLILMLWTVGFSFILYWLMVGESLEHGVDLHDAMHISLGDGHDGPTAIIYYELLSYIKLTIISAIMHSGWTVRIVFGISVWSSVMVLLNLLVSNMVYNYLSLYRSFEELAVRARAQLVVQAEEIMSKNARILFYERCMFHEKLDFDPGDDALTGGNQEILPTTELRHEAFQILDRVERYNGTTNPDAPWDPTSMHSGPTTDSFADTEIAKEGKDEAADEQEGGAIDQNLLRRVTQNAQRLNQELFVLKGALKIGGDVASQGTAASSNSMYSQQSGVEVLEQMGTMKKVKQFTDNILRETAKSRAEQREEADRPSTAQRALSASEAMQAEMSALQAKMAQMMAEMELLRSSHQAQDVPTSPHKPAVKFVTDMELRQHNTAETCWLAVDKKVYDVTDWMDSHPGGRDMLLKESGRDVTTVFASAHSGQSLPAARRQLEQLPLMGHLQRSARESMGEYTSLRERHTPSPPT